MEASVPWSPDEQDVGGGGGWAFTEWPRGLQRAAGHQPQPECSTGESFPFLGFAETRMLLQAQSLVHKHHCWGPNGRVKAARTLPSVESVLEVPAQGSVTILVSTSLSSHKSLTLGESFLFVF